MSPDSKDNPPVFFDASGKRGRRLAWVGWSAAIISTIFGIGFVTSLVISKPVQAPNLPARSYAIAKPELVKKAVAPGLLSQANRLAVQAEDRRMNIRRERRARNEAPSRVHPAILAPQKGRSLAIAFYTNWAGANDASYPALKRALPQLDWVVPSWMALNGPGLEFKTSMDRKALNYIRANKPGVAILPMLQNATAGKWDGAGLQRLLADPTRTAELNRQVVAFIAANKLQGVTIDFENIPKAAHKDLEKFLAGLSQSFAPHQWIIAQAAPFDDGDWPYKEYAQIVDYTMLMAYDQHEISDPAGAIAGQSWYEDILDKRMRDLPADSTIIAVGSYGYDWVNRGAGTPLAFADAMVAARDAAAPIQFDDDTNNPHFAYKESDGDSHEIWFLDGVTVFNQIHAADPYQPAGYALWRLGSEDPSVIPLLGRRYGVAPPASLTTIPTNDDIDYDGNGEILRVEADPAEGTRKLVMEASGDINTETYTALPTNYVIRRVGLSPNKIALTFDDGPDPAWTPQILDILRQKHVPAAFFMIGSNMQAHPGLAQRVLAEGHEVGNHTYTHPNLADTPAAAVRLELNATQRLFEALTGRSMILLRPPYLGDAQPTDADEIVPMEVAQGLGYLTIGTQVDTLDWMSPSVDQMMALVEKQVHHPRDELRGNIVLLHDSGGDRAQTVKLLPVLIDHLRAEGYTFVPVSALAGFSRDQVMPKLPLTVALWADRIVFLSLSYIGQALYYCFIGAIILGMGRLLLLCGLALANRWRKSGIVPPVAGTQMVSVLIPAYNEEKVIAVTIDRILASDYPHMEILVIDDGSADGTAAMVKVAFSGDPRVTLLSIPNGGKAGALNIGLRHAKGEVVVALDADTQFAPDTISKLARWFVDPVVGAVAGNAKVGNRINMITRWQALEYIVAQNLERRALSALDTLTVVPGAVGAWRRKAVLALGGFPTDTLAEDQDLTIAVQVAGYRVLFDPGAIAWTEAPATVRGLAKQRFRWAYGTLQCLWKYRGSTFNPRYRQLGMIALPQVWLFQIMLTTLAPVADLLLVWQLIGQWMNYAQHGSEYSSFGLRDIGIYYMIFMAVDLMAAVVGFAMERRENWSLLWWLVLQRFGYRQIMYYVVMRSIVVAAQGPFVGWGKLERFGTVKSAY